MPFVYLSCFIIFVRVSSTCCKGVLIEDVFALVPDTGRNTLGISPVSTVLALGLLYIVFIKWKIFPSIPGFTGSFIMLDFVRSFLHKLIHGVILFHLLMWWVTLNKFQMLDQVCIFRLNPGCLCYIFFIYIFGFNWLIYVENFHIYGRERYWS